VGPRAGLDRLGGPQGRSGQVGWALGPVWTGWVGPRAGLDRLGGPQRRSGQVSENIAPIRPSRSESLYRLLYPGPHGLNGTGFKFM